MISLRKVFQQKSGFQRHKGRPGMVGGSLPEGEGSATPVEKKPKAKTKDVRASDGKPYKMVEDLSYTTGTSLPNGKIAKRYTVSDLNGKPIGRITETNAYDDRKKTSSGIVLDRRNVVGYNAETFNEKYPIWERSMHTKNRSYAIDWLSSRS